MPGTKYVSRYPIPLYKTHTKTFDRYLTVRQLDIFGLILDTVGFQEQVYGPAWLGAKIVVEK